MRASPITANDSSSLLWPTLTARWGKGVDGPHWYGKQDPAMQGMAAWVGELLWQTLTAKWGRAQDKTDWRVSDLTPYFQGQAVWLAVCLDYPDLPKIECGAPLPEVIRTSSLRVNPRFGEALMGLPQSWTSLTGCACRCWETQ